MRSSGYGSIFFGVIATAIGASLLAVNPINAILLLLGVILLVVGTVNCIRPTPPGILADGISLLAIGGWNIFVFIINMASNSRTTGTPIIAIFQIAWGIASFSRYKRFANAFKEHPTADSLAQIDQMVKDMKKAKFKSSPDIIEFLVQSASRQMPAKARLMEDRAIFTVGGSQDLIIAAKNDVSIVPSGKMSIGKSKGASFTIGDRTYKGSITDEVLTPFNDWKNLQTMHADLPFIT